ncbi:MAG: FkbM family methyltransferase [Planctomycetota bacterium]
MNPLRKLLHYHDQLRLERSDALRIPDRDWRELVRSHNIPSQHTQVCDSGKLRLDKVGIELSKAELPTVVLQGYRNLLELLAKTGGSVSVIGDGDVVFTVDGIHHILENIEQYMILNEIYAEGSYDINTDAPLFIVDAGANAGFASLYFANKLNDVRVHAFEPVRHTFQKAKRNLALNPELSDRINLNNYGLGKDDGKQMIYFDQDRPGNATLVRDNPFTVGVREEIPIEIKRVSPLIDELHESDPSRRILLKLDCEGSEYDILSDLEDSGSLQWISGMMGEWHQVDDQLSRGWIEDLLLRNGFLVNIEKRYLPDALTGVFRAFRLNEK